MIAWQLAANEPFMSNHWIKKIGRMKAADLESREGGTGDQ
jgi:hypothetical protein